MIGASTATVGRAQDNPTVYYQKSVEHADGSTENHTPPQATFTVFLNGDRRRVLLENAPRRNSDQPNITDQGRFGVELGNFKRFSEGDSVFVRYTDNATGEQGLFKDHIDEIPWSDDNPFTAFQLEEAEVPSRPQNVTLGASESDKPEISWAERTDMSYVVYRRALGDELPSGESRMLYHRVADSLTTGEFVGESVHEDSTYAYVVYARSPNGTWSSHSQEVVQEQDRITGLTVESTTATNATLSWEDFGGPPAGVTGRTVGYSVYRRTEGGSYGDTPVGYTGLQDTLGGRLYTDTRLEAGQSYYYKVAARNEELEEYGKSKEIAVTTKSNPDDYYRYGSLKVAVIIYQDTNGGTISDQRVREMKRAMELARLFYWRNSGMRFNVEYTYYVIEGHKDFGNDSNFQSALRTARHLEEDYGVTSTQYDMLFRVTTYKPDDAGAIYFSYGTTGGLDLPGPDRRIGFSTVLANYGAGGKWPGYQQINDTDLGLTWLFVHEGQHAIDAIYGDNGQSQMAHGDKPEQFAVPKGEHYDFQSKIFHHFDAYKQLRPGWGDIYAAQDADGDDFPDGPDARRVPLSEEEFGSSPDQADTDGDGLRDDKEMFAGIYEGSDPTDADTDGDGRRDGTDEHPRYPINPTVHQFDPVIDGTVEEGWPLVNDTVSYAANSFAPKVYMAHDDDSLYLALRTENVGLPSLYVDFGADGYWHGRGNTQFGFDLTGGSISTLVSRDASPEAQSYGGPQHDNSSEYRQEFGRRVVPRRTVTVETNVDLPVIQLELAIAKNEYAGLTLEEGDSLAFYIDYSKVNNQVNHQATTFDKWSFVGVEIDQSVPVEEPLTSKARAGLARNYPNPFRAETTIEYAVSEAGPVTLAVYDVLGRRVATLVDGHVPAGTHRVRLDADGLASGVYFYRLKAEDVLKTRKMTVLE
jgi:hypothetical protein